MCPFCSGVFFQIKPCRMPRNFVNSLNSLELYCEPLSVLILSFAASGFSNATACTMAATAAFAVAETSNVQDSHFLVNASRTLKQ